jgi:type VI protein secretion system component VasA
MLEGVANCRKCRVSFTDSEGMTHAVEVVTSTLYEAAALALAELRRCGFADAEPGAAVRFTVSVEAPATTHELPLRKVMAWLDGGGKSPSEQALKVRVRETLS